MYLATELSWLFSGSRRISTCRALAAKILERDLILHVPRPFDLTRDQQRERAMAMIRRTHEISRTLLRDGKVFLGDAAGESFSGEELFKQFIYLLDLYDPGTGMRGYVHNTLFRETIMTQGTPEQWNKYKADVESLRIYGCFAMTELGHSSFLRGLETTATYNKDTEEFIIHTPSLTATKWWIGGASHTATHTVAICRLEIDGRTHGLHWFVVPLRNPSTGELLPGVSIGDIGQKAGRQAVDNGWIQFTHVRVPRENMLMRWAQVSPQGKVSDSPVAALSYNTLVGERLEAVKAVVKLTAPAAAIAVRYGLVRRQGDRNQRLMDYAFHQHALLPIVAHLYAVQVALNAIEGRWHSALESLHHAAEPAEDRQRRFLRILPDIHGLASALKTWVGWYGADALEQCRRSMGGHAYSAYSGLPQLLADFGVLTTGGGDNFPLAAQAAKALLRAALAPVEPAADWPMSTAYLTGAIDQLRSSQQSMSERKVPVAGPDHWAAPQVLLSTLRMLAAMLLLQCSAVAPEYDSSAERSNDELVFLMLAASRVHTYAYLAGEFWEVVERKDISEDTRGLLSQLFVLFAATAIERELGLLFELRLVDSSQAEWLRKLISQTCAKLTPSAAILVDGFGIPDWVLKSPFGQTSTDIYTAYFDVVRGAPDAVGVAHYWATEVAPLFASKL